MRTRLVSVLLAAALPAAALAHNPWMKPSTTTVSGQDGWVTLDAAASTFVYVADHQPMPFENVKVWQPDGSMGQVENGMRGRFRSTFDVHLTKPGTYRIGTQQQGVFGSYKVDGQQQRLPRGTTPDKIAGLIPANATDVQIMENVGRNDVFVTLGAPTDTVLKPTGKGLEFVPLTHPDDLVANEPATFAFQVDGKPAAGLKVEVISEGKQYRDALGETEYTADAQGRVTVKWEKPGLYWLSASTTDTATTIPGATQRRMNYVANLEVQQP